MRDSWLCLTPLLSNTWWGSLGEIEERSLHQLLCSPPAGAQCCCRKQGADCIWLIWDQLLVSVSVRWARRRMSVSVRCGWLLEGWDGKGGNIEDRVLAGSGLQRDRGLCPAARWASEWEFWLGSDAHSTPQPLLWHFVTTVHPSVTAKHAESTKYQTQRSLMPALCPVFPCNTALWGANSAALFWLGLKLFSFTSKTYFLEMPLIMLAKKMLSSK